jgi:L-ascorbate metabolism protein UlaG (beta-lactamase superfamily)
MAVEITWLGRTCFRLKGRDGVVLTDPCPPDSGYRLAKQQAEVITISRRDDPGYSFRDAISGDEPLILDAPGEYEKGGILVTGVANRRPDGTRNVMFVYELDGIRIGHLGVPGATGGMDDLKDVDILLLPVGGGNSLGGAAAADVMTTIDPKIAIPMNYKTDLETAELEPLEKFVKETGTKAEPQARLQVSKSQLPSDLTVMVLEPR